MNKFNLADEPGWSGAFTRDQAEGAIPNGTRIRKRNSSPEDAHKDGAPGIILGSFRGDKPVVTMGMFNGKKKAVLSHVFYFIEWDDMPKMGIGTVDWRIEEVT